MRNDDIRRILKAQEILSRQLEPIHRATESISRIQSAIQGMQDIISHQVLRVALGPLEDMRRSGHMALASQLLSETSGLTRLLAAEQRFLLPELSDATKLFEEYANRNELDLQHTVFATSS